MSQSHSISKLLVLIAPIALITGCGGIPQEYRGEFVSQDTNDQIHLSARSGLWISSDGSKKKFRVKNSSIENLKAGNPGLYFSDHARKNQYYEIFWIAAVPGTQPQEQAGLFWYDAHILHTLARVSQGQTVDEIPFKKCLDGIVLIDLLSGEWQAGCPENAPILLFKRTRVATTSSQVLE